MIEEDKQKDNYFSNEKSSALRSIGGLLTFSTIIPMKIHTNIENIAKMTWLWPIISVLVGFFGLGIGYFLE